MKKKTERIALEIPGDPRYLCLVRGAVCAMAAQVGFPEKEASHIVLAADEACSNVIRHAYKGICERKNKIIVYITTYKSKIKIKIRDFGPCVDLKKIKGRKLSKVRPGGLGVHFIHGCMDEVVYHTHLKSGTQLVLTKHLRKG